MADGEDEGDNDGVVSGTPKRRSRFESEFDQAVYGSEEEEEGSENSDGDDSDTGASKKHRRSKTYIVEDSDEPLDLLDKKALGNISSTKPVKFREPSRNKSKPKVNWDGKLVIRDDDNDDDENDDDDAMIVDHDNDGSSKMRSQNEPGDGTLEGGINAYVDAIKGKDAVQRGRGGRLKFSNRKEKDRADDEMDMDIDADKQKAVGNTRTRGKQRRPRASKNERERGKLGSSGSPSQSQRKGLGAGKVSGGRVGKGGGGERGRVMGRGRGRGRRG